MKHTAFSKLGLFHMRPQESAEAPDFPLGLGAEGVHELAEARFGDLPAVTGFALAASQLQDGPVAWIRQAGPDRDHGRVMLRGLPALRADPPRLLQVGARRLKDALWALEEAVQSRTVSLVVGEIRDLDFTASRRLTLAARRCGVPVLLLMPYTRDGATAATARWRIQTRPSAPNPFDPAAPGATRWRAVLERCRLPGHTPPHTFDLELDDETLSLSVAAGLAADTPAARPSLHPADPAPDWRHTG